MRYIYLCCTPTDRHFADQLATILKNNFKNTTIEFSEASLNAADLFYYINRCEIFIYLLSPAALKSTWWRAQVHEAARLGKVTQPIVVEPINSLLPLPGKLAPIDMSRGILPEIFLDTLQRLQAPAQSSSSKSRWWLIGVGFLILVILAAAGLIFLSDDDAPTQSNLVRSPSTTLPPSVAVINPPSMITTPLITLTATLSETATDFSAITALTITPSSTTTASDTPTLTPSATVTSTLSPTATLPSATPTATATITLTPTQTLTPSITPTLTRTSLPTRTPTLDARLITCPLAPETRLQINQWVRVTFADGVRLRETAGIDAQTIDYAAVGDILRTIGLPVCRDGILWWKVRLDGGTIGWVAEAESGIYYLEVTER